MSERFIKFIPSEESTYLLIHKPNAFKLLTIVAQRARRESGHPDGLEIGECFLGDWKNCGFSEQEYRTAKHILILRQHLKIQETCRTRKKSTTGSTTVGTKVKLISSTVWDINSDSINDRINDRPTTDQRPTNDKQERIRKKKNEEEEKKNIKKKAASQLVAPSSLTEYFFSSLLSNFPEISAEKLKPTLSQNSAMQKLEMLHGEHLVKQVTAFAHGSDFWVAHIHTPIKLKEKFDTLLAQMSKNKTGGLNGKTHPKHCINGQHTEPEPRFKVFIHE